MAEDNVMLHICVESVIDLQTTQLPAEQYVLGYMIMPHLYVIIRADPPADPGSGVGGTAGY